MSKLDPVRSIPAYAVIIRAEWCRGKAQREALSELHRRGLWLTPDQERAAGLRIVWRCYRDGREFGIDCRCLYDARAALRSYSEYWGRDGYYIRRAYVRVN